VDLDRRQFLAGAATVAGAAAIGTIGAAPAYARTADVRTADVDAHGPFALGVASGDPLPDSVILWTRLVEDPLDASSLPRRPLAVEWEVATDASFRHRVRRGTTLARPELAHSVHVDVRGLEPAREYAYRFRFGGHLSPTARTRTAPAAFADPRRLRIGIVNCQDYQNGYWPAYWSLADEDLDAVFHLGDYIYEYDPHSRFPDRNHTTPDTPGLDQLQTLRDYRNRHALYKLDPALQAAHRNFPWIVTWDDHETENNYTGLVDEVDDTGAMHQDPAQFAVQRSHAYQAYYEHMPVRAAYHLGSPDYRIYRALTFGRMAQFSVLDTRQYRTDQPGGFPGDFGLAEAGIANAAGTMTGGPQEQWLKHNLTRSRARWNVIAQQVMLSRIKFPNPTGAPVPPIVANLDQWDGYVPQRTRLLNFLDQAKIRNPVVLAGDIHSSWFSDLKLDFDDPASKTVSVEFTATSVSSDFPAAFDAPLKAVNPTLNPHVRYFDGSRHGYLRCELTRDTWTTDARTADSIEVRESPTRTTASFVVESGRPGLQPA
jgi:alkaline phosphatase D